MAANQQDFSLAGKKILAAEDNTLNAEILIFLLDDMGSGHGACGKRKTGCRGILKNPTGMNMTAFLWTL